MVSDHYRYAFLEEDPSSAMEHHLLQLTQQHCQDDLERHQQALTFDAPYSRRSPSDSAAASHVPAYPHLGPLMSSWSTAASHAGNNSGHLSTLLAATPENSTCTPPFWELRDATAAGMNTEAFVDSSAEHCTTTAHLEASQQQFSRSLPAPTGSLPLQHDVLPVDLPYGSFYTPPPTRASQFRATAAPSYVFDAVPCPPPVAIPVKLFVNRIPKRMSNDQLRAVFAPFGDVLECNILTDAQGPKGCAFVKYASITDAYGAIVHLHGKRVLNEQAGPVQIKYADGEIDRLGLSADVQPGGESVKVFVGCLPRTCTEAVLFQLFAPFGRVDEVFILRDKHHQSKRSAFVTFPKMSMALNAIKALDKQCLLPVMPECPPL